jgi:DNA-nicking Smr family endonuclease
MPRKSKLSAEDIELFRREAGAVNPLPPVNRANLGKKRKPPLNRPALDRDALQDQVELLDTFEPMESAAGEELSFARPGVQRAQIRKMRKGHYAIRGELDLHGLTTTQARRALVAFLHQCRLRGERCVRIIHGKGYNSPNRRPILKSGLNVWLRQCDEVLAFCSAPSGDGGTGAAYVLLRTR